MLVTYYQLGRRWGGLSTPSELQLKAKGDPGISLCTDSSEVAIGEEDGVIHEPLVLVIQH